MNTLDKALGAFVGLAVGDALGTPVEFQMQGTFPPVTRMLGGGVFNLQPGEWTDDTSMALALADSLLTCKGFDAKDLLERFVNWVEHGHYSHNGRCFDIGGTTISALRMFKATGRTDMADNTRAMSGNGSIMRLAPTAIMWHREHDKAVEYSDLQGKTTHAAPEPRQCCRELASMLVQAMHGATKDDIMDVSKYHFVPGSNVRSSGYCIHTLEAAKWAIANTDNFHDACILAVNLGDDADTVGAVTGQIAGALYGYSNIPQDWLDVLAWHDDLVDIAKALHDFNP